MSEVNTYFKDWCPKILGAPVEDRAALFEEACQRINDDVKDVNPALVKTLCKCMAATLVKYKDPTSQDLVKNFISVLIENHHDVAIESLNLVFKTLVTKELPNAAPEKGAKASIAAISWTIIVTKLANQKSNVFINEKPQLMEYQAMLYKTTLQTPITRFENDAESLFFQMFLDMDEAMVDQHLQHFFSKDPSIHALLFMLLIIRFKMQQGDAEILDKFKNQLIDYFVKAVISGKTKPYYRHVENCRPVLKTLSEEDFCSKILPPLQRAMLRNPEIILQAVGFIVREINIDFSAYAMQIGKVLIQNCSSKDDTTRVASLESLKHLSNKCGDTDVMKELLTLVFAILNGSEGKITVTESRMALIQGAGYLSDNKIPTDKLRPLLDHAVEHFSKTIKSEIHEKTICLALEMFGLWTAKFQGDIPAAVTDLLEKGLSAQGQVENGVKGGDSKNVSQQIRQAYLQCLLSTLQGGKLTKQSDLFKQLFLIVQKAIQNPSQTVLLMEAACAACIILKSKKPDEGDDNSGFWSTMTDMNKQIFFSQRFLSTASSDSLCNITKMAEILLTDFHAVLKGPVDILLKALAHCILGNSKKVRSFARASAASVIQTANGVLFAKGILKEMESCVDTIKIEDGDSADTDENFVTPHSLIEAIRTLCTFKDIACADAQGLALQSIVLCHHPAVLNIVPNLWECILTENFNLDPKLFISINSKHIEELIVENFKPTNSYENVISCVAKISPEIILPFLVTKLLKVLDDPELLSVSNYDYSIYLTPEGELFDKSVLPNSEDIYATSGVKRENKIYSYKEQLEEIELRREIDEKRKKEGKAKPVQLTQKQKEAIRNQTEKEKLVKERLRSMDEILKKTVQLFRAACYGNPKQTSLHFHKILKAILKAMKSPLAAVLLTDFYFFLRTVCFEEKLLSLATDVAILTIRLQQPSCDLKQEWLEMGSSISTAVIELLQNMYAVVIGDHLNEDQEESKGLEASAFSYVFQFIKRAVLNDFVLNNEEVMLQSLQVLEYQAQTKGDTANGTLQDFYHPKYMPRYEMFQLLIDIMTNSRGRIQSKAAACFLDVAKISTGEEYCAIAEKEEIELLLGGLLNKSDIIRDASLRALQIMKAPLTSLANSCEELSKEIPCRLWIAKYDVSADIRLIAEEFWGTLSLPLPDLEFITRDIQNPELCLQRAAAASLPPLLDQDTSILKDVLKDLIRIYNEKLTMIPAKLDKFDREIEPARDQWEPRRGIAIAISQIAQLFTTAEVNTVMQFMVSKGLGDREEIVHKEMLAAGLMVVDLHGKDTVVDLLPVFEDFLDKAPKSQSFDNMRQAVVILMGSLARHLEKDDKRIEPIVRRLLGALSTPSQQVQEAVANCLPHLIPSVKDEAPAMIKKLLQSLIKSDKYGERRGAAYGISGIVKGLGILSLKQYDIMSKLTTFIQDKKNYKSREGALFAFEVLCTTLGRLFEPYIVHVLPHLLQCFGDSSHYVRQAADDTAKVVMGKLSAHGVKLVLPSLLDALDEDSWRTKTASVELLGAMAFCAPKQLSSCLPSIVPKLIEVLGDSHTKVQEAGADALKVIGSVIKNPEIQAIVPILLKALEDPSGYTSPCLQSLLQTKFVHFIDAPSLALIMPVVQRAFMDRSTETRKMAAQIIGNMYSLTDQKDLLPYLPSIIPGLKTSLLDPVPEVRAVSARALGAMVRGMGESCYEDLLPWLMQTLTSESSSVDRSGAAQGLSEVVAGLGIEKLHKLMPEIIATAERTDIAPNVKDGYIMMFIYMPSAFPNEFTSYIGQIINPILKALADENEYVRDTALKAGQRIVNLYAETAVTLLLPELEKGLFDDNWRIRYSSVQLLGDLLYRISGVSGKMTTETANEDDNFGTEQSHQAIIRFLGEERRNRVLSGLYMGRSDVSLMVRQAALHVWKVVVTNTPRTLREILPTLFSLLLGCLASTSYDKRQVAARTLGDLVRKLGERVLPEIIPILEKGLNSEQSDQRQGVCIGLSEIMASTSKEMVLAFVDSLVPTVRKALSDPLPEVREAAAKTFDSLHSTVGSRALDDILPSMLNELSNPDPEIVENTLDGLRQIMFIKSRVVLPYLVPQLTAAPANTKALSILVSVAGEALTKYLPKILNALLEGLSKAQGTPNENQELEYCRTVILSVYDEVGIRTIMDTLMTSAKSENAEIRKSAASLLSAFCLHTQADYSQYVPQLFRCLLRLMAEEDKDILQRSWDALNAVVKALEPAQQIAHVSDVRQAVRFAAGDLKSSELPGFCLPKGIAPLLPIFREAILNGLPEEKENAAQGLGEVISLTNAPSLQPSVVHITGPLIRILGDRFNAGVKAAVLETLAILLHKVGIMLKQFLPQLQTTFLKALHDPNRTVRMKAGQALSELVVIHTRADPLFNEVHNNIRSNDDSAVRETMLQALRSIIIPAGDKVTEPLRKQIYNTLLSMLGHPEEVTRKAAGGCMGSLLNYVTSEQAEDLMKNHILVDDGEDGPLKHGRSVVVFVSLKESAATVLKPSIEDKILKTIISYLSTDKVMIASNGVRAAMYLMQYSILNDRKICPTIINAYIRSMNHSNNEVKQLVAKSCNHLAKNIPAESMPVDLLKYLVPMLVNGTKEKNGYVKSNSEIALLSILRLREDEATYSKVCNILDAGAKDSLQEVVVKVLRKVALQPIGKDEELDDTFLS